MSEIWKDIIGYEGMYQISNLGRVKSLSRVIQKKSGSTGISKEKIMASADNQGYRIIYLHKDAQKEKFTIHRLVATAFICNTENKTDINHINGIKSDNSIYNLEWVTKSENTLHAYRTGLKKSLKGSDNPMSKLTEVNVIDIKFKYRNGGHSYRTLSVLYNVDKALIARIIKGISWPHVQLKNVV